MKFDFNKYTSKNDWILIFIPTIGISKDSDGYYISGGWLCFTFTVEF